MINNKSFLILGIPILLLMSCSSETTIDRSVTPVPLPSAEETEDLKSKLFKNFKRDFPDATVYNTALFDIDKDSFQELIVIFSTEEERINFAFVREKSLSRISLSEGEVYSFDYVQDSLRYDESTNYFLITVYDANKNFTTDYKISVEKNDQLHQLHFKIESL